MAEIAPLRVLDKLSSHPHPIIARFLAAEKRDAERGDIGGL